LIVSCACAAVATMMMLVAAMLKHAFNIASISPVLLLN
jgi:hypothetical protein